MDSIDKDFFLVNYENPIYEGGIQLQDMLRLVLEVDEGRDVLSDKKLYIHM